MGEGKWKKNKERKSGTDRSLHHIYKM